MSPLPHFHTMPEFVYQNLYEFELLDKDNSGVIKDIYPENLSFVSKKEKDYIKLEYLINVKFMNKKPFSNWFKSCIFGFLQVHDKQGMILQRELIELSFESCEINMNGDDVVSAKVGFEIINSEICNGDFKFDRKQIIRNYKLEKLNI